MPANDCMKEENQQLNVEAKETRGMEIQICGSSEVIVQRSETCSFKHDGSKTGRSKDKRARGPERSLRALLRRSLPSVSRKRGKSPSGNDHQPLRFMFFSGCDKNKL